MFSGMIVSSVIAGFLTDTFGRKFFLKLGFAGIFVFTVLGGSSQSYNMLVAAKFFEGILFATAVSALVTVTSEFCHKDIRDRVMLCQSSFAAVGQTIIPAMAWGILIRDWRYSFFDGYVVLNTWNFYLYAMSLWSLASFIMYAFIPESPKYLITKKKYAEAREIIIKIYVENTGNARTTFPYPDLWKNEEKDQKLKDTPITKSISHQIVVGLQTVKVLFRNPLLLYLITLSIMNFLTMGKYNMVRLWYPQISTIIEHGDISGVDLCVLLDKYTEDLRLKSNLTMYECVPTKSGTETYVNTIIIGCVCILPFFISGALVNRVGKKSLFISSSLICVGANLGLRWADSKSTIVALFSLDIAVSQCMKGLIQVQAVEFFPTAVRTLAMSIIMLSARMGTLLANILLPILLDMGCMILFFSLSGVMICITILSIFLPSKKIECHTDKRIKK
ncbi:hypothetical protein O3G_MSEX011092 [Manduca sexta]|uniref:Major facilitator superfamily (MFS) profile domain-containing protein n=1 Tax=Manduca sexta TaxID=7130 RepID=A0A921ZJI3_MANSE|nr:hypothetical protein O3G_MSEX011092 [Manduca sexta]